MANMASCNNKFLGEEGISVIKNYIDNKFANGASETSACTIQLYKYSTTPIDANDKPSNNIFFNFKTGSLSFPNEYDGGWNILSNITIEDGGEIYMSSKFQVGNNDNGTSNWSNPVKVSGVNGLNGKNGTNFLYSYKPEFDKNDYSTIAPDLNETSGPIYYWLYIDELPEDGTPGAIWAKYTTDGKDGKDGVDGKYIAYEYCVTAEYDNTTTGDWERSIPEISKEKPYLWVRTQSVAAQSQPDPANWEPAVLLSSLGKDGTVPDYNVTLYKKGKHFECPEALKFEDGYTLEDLYVNNTDWKTLPENEEEEILAYAVNESVSLTTKEEIDAILTENSNTSVEFKLDADVDLVNTALVITSEVTVDLNGHTITGGLFSESGGNILEGSSDSYVFWVKEGGKLTINDSVGTGKVIAREADYSMAVWVNGGEAIINGGNFYNAGDNCDLVYASALVKEDGSKVGSHITVNGGYFEATDKLIIPGAGTGYKRSALNIKNADIEICTITVMGGQFLDFDPTNLDKEVGGITSFVPEGLETTIENGIVTVKKPLLVYESPVWWKCTIKVSGKDDKIIKIGDIFRYSAVDGNAKDGKYTKFMYKWSETQAAPELIDNTSIKPEGWDYNPIENKIDGPNTSLWMITAEFDIPNEYGEVLKYSWSNPVKISGEPILSPYIFKTRNFYCIGNISGTNLPKWDSNNWKDLNKISNNLKNDQYIWVAEYVVRYPITYIKDKEGNYKFDKDGNYEYTIAEIYDKVETYPTSAVRFSGTNGKDGSNGADAVNSNYIMMSSEPAEINIPVAKSDYENYNIYVAKAKVDYKMNIEPIKFSDGVSYRICNMSGEVITISDDNYQFTGIGIENTSSVEIPNNNTLNIVCYKPNANSTPQYFVY